MAEEAVVVVVDDDVESAAADVPNGAEDDGGAGQPSMLDAGDDAVRVHAIPSAASDEGCVGADAAAEVIGAATEGDATGSGDG